MQGNIRPSAPVLPKTNDHEKIRTHPVRASRLRPPAEDIERVETLPADEETIARYGLRASNGVLLVTLRYDSPAVFPSDSTFGRYIARRVEWPDDEPAARVVLRYKITPEGRTVVDQELEVTDKRLRSGSRPARTACPSKAKGCCASSFPKASASPDRRSWCSGRPP